MTTRGINKDSYEYQTNQSENLIYTENTLLQKNENPFIIEENNSKIFFNKQKNCLFICIILMIFSPPLIQL